MKKYYHGAKERGPYFEGWYLKFQTKEGKALALIPALHMDKNGRRSASLQVITGDRTWWLDYPEREFHASENQFQIRVGQSAFHHKGVDLDIEQRGLSLHGTLRCGCFTPLKSDIMGPFRFLPGMECSHGVISMGHLVGGVLVLNGEAIVFSGGIGYVETDRGRSFPSVYLWAQCAWQGPGLSSLMLSIAAIPLAGRQFTGCICSVVHKGREYRLATYRGVRIEGWSDRGASIRQGKYRLTVEVLERQGRPLRAPVEGDMGRTIHESLCSKMRCRFWEGEKLLFDHTDLRASFEYAALGDPSERSSPNS